MPEFYMLVGIPASGKSTWVEWFRSSFASADYPLATVSTDDHVQRIADLYGITYQECHNDLFNFADAQATRDLKHATKNEMNILWDQTNLTPKSRARKLIHIPRAYKKIAVVFEMPDEDEWRRRLASRPGKVIPESALQAMKYRYQQPLLAEGFDYVGYSSTIREPLRNNEW